MAKKKPVIVQGEELPYNPDDDMLSIKLAEEWRGKAAYFQSAWRVYENGVWTERDVQEVKRNIRLFLRDKRGILPKGVSQGRINSIAAMMEDDCFLPDRKLIELQRPGAQYINLRNGLFNLDEMKLEPHNSEMYITTQLDFDYDLKADCPHFHKFVRSSLANPDGTPDWEMIALAQEALAYSMTARTDFKSSFWLIGKPDTGKSTLLGVIRSLMGNLHATVDLNQLKDNRFLLAGIAGKRVVTFSEADTNSFLPDALYKNMVGGQDEVYTDVKNKPGFHFVPIAKFWWAMNGAPRTTDRSGAIFNRLLPILFDYAIPVDQRNPNLPGLLAQEKAGIFNYLMLGWDRLLTQGKFTLPKRSEAWRDEYRRENDTEVVYFQERLKLDPDGKLYGGELYQDYRMFCENSGFKPKNLAQIAKEWRRLGLKDYHSNGKAIWQGAKFQQHGTHSEGETI